jgi:hypothetical protein
LASAAAMASFAPGSERFSEGVVSFAIVLGQKGRKVR